MVVMAGLFGFAGASDAYAVTPVQLNEPITINYENNYEIYEITAPETGTLYMETDSWQENSYMYYDEECASPMRAIGVTNGRLGYTYLYEVQKDKHYYFSHRETAIMGDFLTVNFTMELDVPSPEILFLHPQCGENKVYNLALTDELQLIFSIPTTTFDDAYLEYTTPGGEEKEFKLDYYKIDYDNSWRFNVNSALTQLADAKEIAGGSVFKVVVVNVNNNGQPCSGEYAVNGNIELPYVYSPLAYVVSESWPTEFLTYWPEGDPAGIAKVTFSAPLADPQPSTFEYGVFAGNDRESETGMPRLANPKISIDGPTLIIDFTGVARPTKEALVTVEISHIEDAAGMAIDYFGGQGIIKEIDYKTLEPIVLTYELTPASGSLKIVDEIELWIENNAWDHIQIEGFLFDCGAESVTVDIEDCTVEPDAFDPQYYTLVYIPVPEIAKKNENVTMSAIINSLDGYEDYNIQASYTNPQESGIVGIDAEGTWEVYNVQGIRVMKTDKYNDIRSLPKGIYIVNGVKVKI